MRRGGWGESRVTRGQHDGVKRLGVCADSSLGMSAGLTIDHSSGHRGTLEHATFPMSKSTAGMCAGGPRAERTHAVAAGECAFKMLGLVSAWKSGNSVWECEAMMFFLWRGGCGGVGHFIVE